MSGTDLLKQMGERIYERRKALKLTQEQLAEKLGVSTQMISNLELGKKAIRPENLVKLSAVLDISTDYILKGNLPKDNFTKLSDKITNLTPNEIRLLESLVDYMNNK